jgi:hypothetical protein
MDLVASKGAVKAEEADSAASQPLSFPFLSLPHLNTPYRYRYRLAPQSKKLILSPRSRASHGTLPKGSGRG